MGSFKTLLRTQRQGLPLSCILAQLVQPTVPGAWACPGSTSPPCTHLPIDKAVQRDPSGPHVQSLERSSLRQFLQSDQHPLPTHPAPVGHGRGHDRNLFPQSCIHSTNTPRPLFHARPCAEHWGHGDGQSRPPALQGFQVSLEQAQNRHISNSVVTKPPSFTGSPLLYPRHTPSLETTVYIELPLATPALAPRGRPSSNDPLEKPPPTFFPTPEQALALGYLHNPLGSPMPWVQMCRLSPLEATSFPHTRVLS